MLFTIIVLVLAATVPGFAGLLRFAVGMLLVVALAAVAAGSPGDALWALTAAGVGCLGVWLRRRVVSLA